MSIALVPFDASHTGALAIAKRFRSAAEIESLYLSAFPPEERRPFAHLTAPATNESDPYVLLIETDGLFAGFFRLWNFGKFAYVEYFALESALRGQGIGTAALSLLKEKMAMPIVLEVERPSQSEPLTERRIDFYRRNGFEVISCQYIQPPYGHGLPEVPMWLMATDTSLDPAGVAETLHRHVYGVSR